MPGGASRSDRSKITGSDRAIEVGVAEPGVFDFDLGTGVEVADGSAEIGGDGGGGEAGAGPFSGGVGGLEIAADGEAGEAQCN